MLPSLAGLLLFFLLPFFIAVQRSMMFGLNQFVGLRNYVEIWGNPAFRLAAGNTLRFLAVGVPSIFVLSFLLALGLRRRFAGFRLFQPLLLVPLVLPIAATVAVLQVLFSERGVWNAFLTSIGMEGMAWLESDAAFWILIALFLWKNCGYNVVLMLCGLNMIPAELWQIADLEGAGSWQKMRHVTLPLMSPTFFFVFVISVVNSFKSYREAFLLAGTHPHDSIYLLQHFINNNFENLNYPRLSVATLLLFLLILVLVALLYWRQGRREVV